MISNRLDSHVEWKFCCAVFHDFFCGKQWWFLNPGCWKLSNLISVSFFILIQQKKLPIFCLYHTSALWSFTDFHHLHIFIFPSSRSSQYEWSRTEILRHYFFHKKKIHEINNLKGLFLEEKNSGYFCWRQTKFILSQISKLFIYVITRFVKINGMRAWGKNEEMRLNRTA